jgi:tetratricopeptide (TPR) repeat protein
MAAGRAKVYVSACPSHPEPPTSPDAVTATTLLDEIPPGAYVPAARPHSAAEPDAPPPGDAAGAVEHVLASAGAARGRMAWARADTLAREGAELARRLRLPALLGAALNESAAARIHAGMLDDAGTTARNALAGDPAEHARAEVNLGIVAALRGDTDEALARFAAAEAAAHADGDEWTLLLVQANRAVAQVARNELAAAQKSAEDALRTGRRARDDHRAALGSVALACAHHARGVRNEARTRLAEAVRAFTRSGDRLRMVQCHFMLGEIAYEAEDPIRAGSHYRDGLAVAREAGATALVELLSLRFEHR